MLRWSASFRFVLILSLAICTRANADGVDVRTDIPAEIEDCVKTGLEELWAIETNDQESLFEYFLANIDAEQFGRYNYKRAWFDWGENSEIKRLALFEYAKLMMSERSEYQGFVESFDARLADRPLVKGDDVYHIVVQVDFSDGSSTSVVVFTVGCRAFGFMYGGANLRSFVNPDLIERMYRSGKRAPD